MPKLLSKTKLFKASTKNSAYYIVVGALCL